MRSSRGRIAGVLSGALALVVTSPTSVGADEPVPLVDQAPANCEGPTSCVIDIDVPVPDGVVVPGDDERPGNRVRVVLPPGYSADTGTEHPLLLLLHGVGDGSETWTENTDVEELVAELCASDPERCPVVVMPDGGGKHSEPGWYTDWFDGSRHWETFHTAVVLPWVGEHLAVAGCREATMVAGLSMGGFGSFSYAGRHPDLFMAAASFSGFLDTRPAPPVSTIGFQLANDNGLGAPTEDMFGPAGLPTEHDGWAEHNPTDLARAGAYEAYEGNLWLATGTGTPGGPAGDEPDNAGSYALEAFVFENNQNFRVAMAQAGSTFHDQSYVGGNHAWPYWQSALRTALPEMLDVVEPCVVPVAGVDAPTDVRQAAGRQPSTATPAAVTDQALPATGMPMRTPMALAAGMTVLGLALRSENCGRASGRTVLTGRRSFRFSVTPRRGAPGGA